MRNLKLSLIAILMIGLISSCKKDTNEDDQLINERAFGVVPATQQELDSIPIIDTAVLFSGKSGLTLPATFSLDMPPIKNQGGEGSCVAFASGYAARSYHWHRDRNQSYLNGSSLDESAIFSPEYIYNSVKFPGTCRDAGTQIPIALNLLKDEGVSTWAEMPYSSTNGCETLPSGTQKTDAALHKIKNFGRINNISSDNLKSIIFHEQPIVFAAKLDDGFWRDGDFIWDKKHGDELNGSHAMVLCGWDDTKNAYKVMNSWGTTWGYNGFGWIDYDYFKSVVLGIGAFSLGYYEVYTLQTSDTIETNNCSGFSVSASVSGSSITANPTGGTSPYTYSWSNGKTTKTISGLNNGTYTVTTTDNEGCTAIASGTVGVDPCQSNPVSVNAVVSGTSITANPSGGTTPYSYSWSNGETTKTISGLSNGTYRVTVTDNNGCSASASGTVGVDPCQSNPVSVNAVVSGTSITANPSGGTAPYSYSWSNGETTKTISGLSNGTYTVTATDINGCSASASGTVSVDPCIANPLTISVTVSGTDITLSRSGTSPYDYNWSGPNGYTSTSRNLSNLDPGTYYVTVTDANGCTATDFGTVSGGTQPIPITPTDVCTSAPIMQVNQVYTVSVSTSNYTFGAPIDGESSGGSNVRGFWLAFEIPSTSAPIESIEITNVSSNFNPVVGLKSNCSYPWYPNVSGSTNFANDNGNGGDETFSTYIPYETIPNVNNNDNIYYIRLYHYDGSQTPSISFDIIVQ